MNLKCMGSSFVPWLKYHDGTVKPLDRIELMDDASRI